MCVECMTRLFNAAATAKNEAELGAVLDKAGLTNPETAMAKQLKLDLIAEYNKQQKFAV